LTFIQEIYDFIEWVLVTQIYLVIFFTSFAYTYLQQMLPVQKSIKIIKEKQVENRWVIPRLMTNRLCMNVALWLGAVLFFSGIMISLGVLYDESVPDKEKFDDLRITLFFTGFALLPAVSLFYSVDFDSILKKYEIKLSDDSNWGVIISITSLIFFISLSYVAILCFDVIHF
jgi:hypothetical protein